jgi:death-on-curing protein
VGHAALEVMLLLNGAELNATVDEGEQIILAVASEHADRAVLTRWVEAHI